MKTLLFVSLTLAMSSAFAANDSITVCNPSNKAQSLSVSIKGNKMSLTNTDGKTVEKQEVTLDKTVEVSLEDLRDIAGKNNLPVNLESGTAYIGGQEAFVIANDSKGVKYLIQVVGPYSQVMGNSDSCK